MQIPAKRYRIGEIVRCSPFSRQTIHNYTIMGLIREAEWTEGGHRLYDETVFERLSRIDRTAKNQEPGGNPPHPHGRGTPRTIRGRP